MIVLSSSGRAPPLPVRSAIYESAAEIAYVRSLTSGWLALPARPGRRLPKRGEGGYCGGTHRCRSSFGVRFLSNSYGARVRWRTSKRDVEEPFPPSHSLSLFLAILHTSKRWGGEGVVLSCEKFTRNLVRWWHRHKGKGVFIFHVFFSENYDCRLFCAKGTQRERLLVFLYARILQHVKNKKRMSRVCV